LPPAQTPQLLRAFFEASRDAVRCLASEPGFQYEHSVDALTETGARRVTSEETAAGFFFAGARFGTHRVAGEITLLSSAPDAAKAEGYFAQAFATSLDALRFCVAKDITNIDMLVCYPGAKSNLRLPLC